MEMSENSIIRYVIPADWTHYDRNKVFEKLCEARGWLSALTSTPFQREWVEKLQATQLKMEVAGTSRIEGADFTESELDAALRPGETAESLATRSQRQARSAIETYQWIANLPLDQPFTSDLVREVHRRIVTGCDDDHCEPGALRRVDYNVTFGVPLHRGCEGGAACEEAFDRLIRAVAEDFRGHDTLIQALAFHYHFAAMHPFMDGNGRTARAVEALLLQRSGLRDTAFIAMSNYYYDEKTTYLSTLASARSNDHDLTEFLVFGLTGIAVQCKRLYSEIKRNMQKALFRNTMYELFSRLKGTRTRVIQKRQIEILKLLLEDDEIDWADLFQRVRPLYASMKSPLKALARDMTALTRLGAIRFVKIRDGKWMVYPRLEWPSEITETVFFATMKNLPKGKTYAFLP